MIWSKTSYFGLSEIASLVFLFLFKDGERRVSRKFHLFVSDVNQWSENVNQWSEAGFKISLHDSRGREILLRSSVSC